MLQHQLVGRPHKESRRNTESGILRAGLFRNTQLALLKHPAIQKLLGHIMASHCSDSTVYSQVVMCSTQSYTDKFLNDTRGVEFWSGSLSPPGILPSPTEYLPSPHASPEFKNNFYVLEVRIKPYLVPIC